MVNTNQYGANSYVAPYIVAKTPTKSDTTNEAAAFRGIFVGGAGNISVNMMDGSDVVFTAIPVGTFMPVSGQRINNTNTTATNLLILY